MSSDSAETNSPQTLCRGNSPASSRATLAPKRAAVIAADAPAGPPPMTTRSNSGCAVTITLSKLLPNEDAHAKQKVPGDLNAPCRYSGQQSSHFVDRVGTAHRGRRVVPGDTAAEQRQSEIDQREMQSAADQVVNEYGLSRHAKCFCNEAS